MAVKKLGASGDLASSVEPHRGGPAVTETAAAVGASAGVWTLQIDLACVACELGRRRLRDRWRLLTDL